MGGRSLHLLVLGLERLEAPFKDGHIRLFQRLYAKPVGELLLLGRGFPDEHADVRDQLLAVRGGFLFANAAYCHLGGWWFVSQAFRLVDISPARRRVLARVACDP